MQRPYAGGVTMKPSHVLQRAVRARKIEDAHMTTDEHAAAPATEQV